MAEKKKIIYLYQKNPKQRRYTAEHCSVGGRVNVIDGFCATVSKLQAHELEKKFYYEQVHIFKVPKPIRDKLKAGLKVA